MSGIEEPQQRLDANANETRTPATEFDPSTMGDVPTGRPPKPEFKSLTPATISNVKIFMDDKAPKKDLKDNEFFSGYIQFWFKLDAPQGDTTEAVENYGIRFYKNKEPDGTIKGVRAYFGSDKAQQESYAHALRNLALETYGDQPGVSDAISLKAFVELVKGKKVQLFTDQKSPNKKIVIRAFVRG